MTARNEPPAQPHAAGARGPARRGAAAAAALCVVLAACAPRVSIHGNSPDPERVAEIVPGTHTRQDVELILGSPSSVSLFDNETWYYIGDQQETIAFLEPEVVKRDVVVVRFDDGGYVAAIEAFGKERGRPVEFVDRETPTRGNEMTVFEQLIGNIGRFEGSSK